MSTLKILAPHFTATVTFEDGIVVRAAPVIKYMIRLDAGSRAGLHHA